MVYVKVFVPLTLMLKTPSYCVGVAPAIRT